MNGQKKSKWNLEIVARNSYSLYFAGAVAIPNTNRPENNNYENNFELSLNFKCDVVRSLVDIFHCMRCGGSEINQGVYTLYQAEQNDSQPLVDASICPHTFHLVHLDAHLLTSHQSDATIHWLFIYNFFSFCFFWSICLYFVDSFFLSLYLSF